MGALAGAVKRKLFNKPFPGSEQFWIDRYAEGGTSGLGSSGKLAEFKAEVVNEFVRRHEIASVMEFGCGDGEQLRLAAYPRYLGFDVSPNAIRRCWDMFRSDPSKSFKLMKDYRGEWAELTLSLDVIYHLIEYDRFVTYMRRLFGSSRRFVMIYSTDTAEQQQGEALHIRHRLFTKWVEENLPDWQLIQHVPNRHPDKENIKEGSSADFYIYETKASETG